jgi:hypothetical protein
MDVRLGEERALPLNAIPERWSAPVPPSISPDPEATWEVRAGDAEGGDVVRLPVPGHVLEAVGCNPHRLRIHGGAFEVPFVIRPLDGPEPVLVLRDLPSAGKPLSRSRTLRIEDPALSGCLSQLELFASGEERRPSVRFRFLERTRPGIEERALELRSRWDCAETESLPCRADVVPPATGSTDTLVIHIERGQGARDASYDLVAWAPRYELVFVRPSAGDVVLADAGATALWEAYPLEKVSGLLLAHPWESVTVEPGPAGEESTGLASRFALIAALIATAAALLWILSRNLRRPDLDRNRDGG